MLVSVKASALLGAALTLGGCAVGPDFKPPTATVSEKWAASDNPHVAQRFAADTRWWRSFDDPVLDRLVERAYEQNLTLQIAGLRIVEARAQLALATGQQFPQSQAAFGNASAIGLSENISRIGNLPRNYVGYQVGFDAAWELDFWGKFRRGVEAQAAGVLASMADYASAIVSLTAEIARTYVQIRTTEVLIDQARDNVAIQEKALDIATSRFRNGESSELDPTQARTLLESTRATIPQRQIELQQARNALATLLGQPAGTLDALLMGGKGIPKVPPDVAVGVPAAMLRRRPDIKSAELQAAAQCARIGVAKADLYPSFSLVGTIGLDASTRGTGSSNLFSTSSIFYQAGPQVNWTFLNYGRTKNAIRIEDARFQQLLVNYRNTVLKAAQEVEDALVGFVNAQEAVTSVTAAVKSAERAVELSFSAYREGAVDYQRVLDAERSLLEQQDSLAAQTSSVVTYVVALYKALGGGWEAQRTDRIVPEETRREMEERTDWGHMLTPAKH